MKKLFNKWILWKMQKKAARTYLSKKERKKLENKYYDMMGELLKAVPNNEMVSNFIALLALEREPVPPEDIFNLGLACFLDSKDLERSYQTLAIEMEKAREEIRNSDERKEIFLAVSFFSERITTQESFFDEFIKVYMKLTGAAKENEYNFFRLGFYSSSLYSLIF